MLHSENANVMKPIEDDPDWIVGVDDLDDLDDLDDVKTPSKLLKPQGPPTTPNPPMVPTLPRPRQELIWNECARCHRRNTLEETPADEADDKEWRCRACREVIPYREVWGYQDDVMTNVTGMPDCPPIIMAAMSRSGEMLLGISRGERVGPAAAGNMARLLLRLLEQYGIEQEEWHDRAGQ